MQVSTRHGVFDVAIDGAAHAPALLLSNSLSSDMPVWNDEVPLWPLNYLYPPESVALPPAAVVLMFTVCSAQNQHKYHRPPLPIPPVYSDN